MSKIHEDNDCRNPSGNLEILGQHLNIISKSSDLKFNYMERNLSFKQIEFFFASSKYALSLNPKYSKELS
jgi:hypothetical protein